MNATPRRKLRRLLRSIGRSALLLALGTIMIGAGGCASKQADDHAFQRPLFEHESYDRPQPARSLALTGPVQLDLERAQPLHDPPWYADRLDRGPMVIAGYESATIERQVQSRYDSRHHHRGRVNDHFRQYNRQVQVKEMVR